MGYTRTYEIKKVYQTYNEDEGRYQMTMPDGEDWSILNCYRVSPKPGSGSWGVVTPEQIVFVLLRWINEVEPEVDPEDEPERVDY